MIINDYMVSKSHVWCFSLEIFTFFVLLTYKIYQTLNYTLQNPYSWQGVRVWRVRVGVQLKYPRVTCDNLYMVTQVVPKAKWLWEQDTQRHLKDTLVRVGVLVGLMGHWFTGDSVIQNQALNYFVNGETIS